MPKPFLFIEPTIVKRSTMECSQIQCENILHSILCNRGAAHISDFRRRNNERLGCDPALQLEGLFIHPRFSRAWLSSVQHRLKPVQQASLRLYGNDRSDESALPKLPHGRHACLTLRISLPPPVATKPKSLSHSVESGYISGQHRWQYGHSSSQPAGTGVC
jgi:hypothetical protein